jgi:hypothetical protein
MLRVSEQTTLVVLSLIVAVPLLWLWLCRHPITFLLQWHVTFNRPLFIKQGYGLNKLGSILQVSEKVWNQRQNTFFFLTDILQHFS